MKEGCRLRSALIAYSHLKIIYHLEIMALRLNFIKHFGILLGINSLNYSYKCGELSNTQKQAIITLIEKRNICNWKPISLINVDAKIGSKVTATRLQKVLGEIIHFNQNAYVKGRTILDAVRTVDDILEYTERKNISGLLVAMDFQKAFDLIKRNFMVKALSAFNTFPTGPLILVTPITEY